MFRSAAASMQRYCVHAGPFLWPDRTQSTHDDVKSWILKYNINIMHVVELVTRNVKSCKHDMHTRSIHCAVNNFKTSWIDIATCKGQLTLTRLDHYERTNFPADKKFLQISTLPYPIPGRQPVDISLRLGASRQLAAVCSSSSSSSWVTKCNSLLL